MADVEEGKVDADFSLSSKRKLVFGLLIVLGISFTWVGSTQTAQSTYTGTFNAPFFNVWLSTCTMTLVAVPFMATIRCQGKDKTLAQWLRQNGIFLGERGITPMSLLLRVFPFAVLWMVTNYCYLRALGFIAATDVTALFSSCNGFVYVFSLCLLKEPLSAIRVISVLLASSGIAVMSYADGFSAANIQGVILSVVAAVGAALYKVSFKRVFGEPNMAQVALFLSLLGLTNLLCFWPIFEILYYTNTEVIDWNEVPWAMLLSSAAFGLVFNFLINFGVAFTFPLFISLGTVLGIPVNALVDDIFRNKTFTGTKIGAAFLIIGGFLLMLLPLDFLSKIWNKKYKHVQVDSVAPSGQPI